MHNINNEFDLIVRYNNYFKNNVYNISRVPAAAIDI